VNVRQIDHRAELVEIGEGELDDLGLDENLLLAPIHRPDERLEVLVNRPRGGDGDDVVRRVDDHAPFLADHRPDHLVHARCRGGVQLIDPGQHLRRIVPGKDEDVAPLLDPAPVRAAEEGESIVDRDAGEGELDDLREVAVQQEVDARRLHDHGDRVPQGGAPQLEGIELRVVDEDDVLEVHRPFDLGLPGHAGPGRRLDHHLLVVWS